MQVRTILAAFAIVLGGALTLVPAATAAPASPHAPDKPLVSPDDCEDGGGHLVGVLCVGGDHDGESIIDED